MCWDQTIVFGMGKQKLLGSLTGFHRNKENRGVFSGVLFRGESADRHPALMFSAGFQLRTSGFIHGRQASSIPGVNNEDGTTRGCLSFSLRAITAAHWAAENDLHEGWCYCVYLAEEPWAAEGRRNMTSPTGIKTMDYQGEILLRPEGGVKLSGDHIWAARRSVRGSQSYRKITSNFSRYDSTGKKVQVKGPHWVKGYEEQGQLALVGPLIRNPSYKGPDVGRLAVADPEYRAFIGTGNFVMPPEIA